MSGQGIAYTYVPLPRDRDDIRLLKLMPLSSSNDIEIEIIHVPSSTPPAYEALSYVWGSPERIHRVSVKPCFDMFCQLNIDESVSEARGITGRQSQPGYLSISQNLSIALQHLRLSEEPRVLWIDAICINQEDSAERSEQVLKMGFIYSKAQRVILWLGDESKDSTQAVDAMRILGEGLKVDKLGGGVYDIFPKPSSLAEKLEASPMAMAERELDWMAIGRLLNRACQ